MLKVLVRVSVPVWDHRGTQELVVAVRGSPPSPADGSPGWLHNATPPLCRVRRQGEPLPRPAFCEILAPLEKLSRAGWTTKTEGLKEHGLARQPGCFLVPSDSRQCLVWGGEGLGEAAWVCKLPAALWRKMLLEPRAAIWLVLAIWVQSLQECRRHCQERKEQPQHAKRGLLNTLQISSGHREATPKGQARHVLL